MSLVVSEFVLRIVIVSMVYYGKYVAPRRRRCRRLLLLFQG
jgi:hypothetical protein